MENYFKLRDYQLNSVKKMHNGCILLGGVGSGKSRTSLAFYHKFCGGTLLGDKFGKMKAPKDLYIITTAKKRDDLDWEGEMTHFLINWDGLNQIYSNKAIVDSWNNIKKYKDVKNAFFIFDEQRLVGNGSWVKSFYKIAKRNNWILLSATPGDTWIDYIPVFVANRFYKNKTEFMNRHAVFSRYSKFPKVERFIEIDVLIKHQQSILVTMDFERQTKAIHEDVLVGYDKEKYKYTTKNKWNPYKEEYIMNIPTLFYVWRRITNEHEDRINKVLELHKQHKRIVIFYRFNYELDILKNAKYDDEVVIAQLNGSKHDVVPNDERWIYLVQYTSGSEAWNCITCDTMIFYSQDYSYRVMEQSSGRIDRMNTPFKYLYYYHFISKSPIDLAIARSLRNKKNFNEKSFIKKLV